MLLWNTGVNRYTEQHLPGQEVRDVRPQWFHSWVGLGSPHRRHDPLSERVIARLQLGAHDRQTLSSHVHAMKSSPDHRQQPIVADQLLELRHD